MSILQNDTNKSNFYSLLGKLFGNAGILPKKMILTGTKAGSIWLLNWTPNIGSRTKIELSFRITTTSSTPLLSKLARRTWIISMEVLTVVYTSGSNGIIFHFNDIFCKYYDMKMMLIKHYW